MIYTLIKKYLKVSSSIIKTFKCELNVLIFDLVKPKKTLVSGKAGDEKNLQPGGCKFIFLIDFPEIFSILCYFLLLFLILVFFVYLLFFEIKNIYSDPYLTIWAGE